MRILCLLPIVVLISMGFQIGPGITGPYPGVAPDILPSRIALVIGVDFYGAAGPSKVSLSNLKGAAKDAEAVKDVLKDAGFDYVKLLVGDTTGQPGTDKFIRKSQIDSAISDINLRAKSIAAATGRRPIVLFYFAGHGMNLDGESYLAPSDFRADDVENVKEYGVSVRELISARLAESKPELKILIFDACRTTVPDKLPRRLSTDTVRLKPGAEGISESSTNDFENHTYYLFATSQGSISSEDDKGGVFTKAFTRRIKSSAAVTQDAGRITLHEIFSQIKNDLQFAAGTKQLPRMDNAAMPFFLFPTDEDFTLEKKAFRNQRTFAAGKVRPDGSTDTDGEDQDQVQLALNRIACGYIDILNRFSRYSYFSMKVISNIQRFRPPEEELNCDTQTNLTPGKPSGGEVRDSEGKWRRGMFEDKRFHSSFAAATNKDINSRDQRSIVVGSSATTAQLLSGDQTSSKSTKSPTVADLRRAMDRLAITPKYLPPDDLSIDAVVVTKEEVHMRDNLKLGPQSPSLGIIPAGEFVELRNTSPNRTWLEISYPPASIGYLSNTSVEPAAIKISKIVNFNQRDLQGNVKLELDDTMESELFGAFGLLGGVAVLDTIIEYPKSSQKRGLVRATEVRNFLYSLTSAPSERTPPVLGLRSADLDADVVRVTVLGVPLDRKTRLALTNAVGMDNRVVIDLVARRKSLPSTTLPQLRICQPEGPCSALEMPTVRGANLAKDTGREAIITARTPVDAMSLILPRL